MSEKDVYIGGTSIQIGEHGFINQPKEIIEYIKYLQTKLQQKESIIKEVREEIEYFDLQAKHLDDNIYLDEKLTNKLLEILDKE